MIEPNETIVIHTEDTHATREVPTIVPPVSIAATPAESITAEQRWLMRLFRRTPLPIDPNDTAHLSQRGGGAVRVALALILLGVVATFLIGHFYQPSISTEQTVGFLYHGPTHAVFVYLENDSHNSVYPVQGVWYEVTEGQKAHSYAIEGRIVSSTRLVLWVLRGTTRYQVVLELSDPWPSSDGQTHGTATLYSTPNAYGQIPAWSCTAAGINDWNHADESVTGAYTDLG